MQVNNDVLYCGIRNQPFSAYSSLYLSDFLSFHTLNNEIFRQRFCETMQATGVIFGMLVVNDGFYCVIVNQPSAAYSSLYLSDFLSFHTLNNEIFRQRFCETMQATGVIFGMLVVNDGFYCVIVNQPSAAYSSLYLIFFPYMYFE